MRDNKRNKFLGRSINLLICIVLVTSLVTSVFGSPIKENEFNNFSIKTEGKKTFPKSDVEINVESYGDATQITYHINGFKQKIVNIDGQKYHKILLDDESNIMMKGMPDLPNIRRSVIIPDNKLMKIKVLDSQFKEYSNINIAPSKGILPRTVNPEDIPYEFERIYSMDTIFPKTITELGSPYILRDYRGIVVTVNPFQYNPKTKTLRFYTDITIEIYPDGDDYYNCIYRDEPPAFIDTDFKLIYEHHFLNFDTGKYTPVEEQGNLLIITYEDFWDEMIPFVQWKTMKGIPTEMVTVSDAGGSANAIKSYIESYYNANGLTFVLLVGDIDQVPSIILSGSASDPSYSFIVGSDHYPDLFVGRFSANNLNELETQIERSIEYEKYPQIGADWYQKGTGIGSDEGTGDDGEWDWEHIRNIRTDLLGYTYTWVDEFYGGSQGGEDAPGNPNSGMISAALNNGRSFINYCGHGGWDGWGWSSVSGWYVFQNSDVNILLNDNMLPFIISVACDTGMFDVYTTCFGEAWMRATHNGEPTGGIGFFGSTISQSWDPPMDAQDEIVDLLVMDQKNTFGGLCFNGVMHMNDEYGAAGYEETDYWTVFGDPSLQVRTDSPFELTVNHDTMIFDGSISYELDVVGIEDALCSISYNYQLLGYAYTDEFGHAVITFDEPITDIESVDLVVTAYNAVPYITTLDVVSKRQPAEFEPMQGILIRYPFGISYDIIAEMSEDVQVVTIVANAGEESYVTSQYLSHGVNLDNCIFLHAPTDTYWTRDYGPWFIYDVEGNQAVVDFEYNRPRPNDNAIPAAFASEYGLPLVDLGLVHSGGNYMTDGQGIAVSTDLVDTENPGYTIEDIQQIAADILGIRTYHIIPDPLGAYIEHVDCFAKFLAPDKIMILEVPPGHSQYDELETTVDYFESQLTCYNTPYEIYRAYASNPEYYYEAYINSLILNDKVFVPIVGGGHSWDDDAIASYEAAMPGYEVLGFTGSWDYTDAIHCRAKGIPDRYMLYIEHTPLLDGFPSDDGFLVEARIQDYSDAGIIPESVQVFYKVGSGSWDSVQMIDIGNDRYQVYIPPAPAYETVYYYIHAEDYSGRSENHPYIGELGAHSFLITPVPEIWVSPTSFDINAPTNTIATDTLTIGNDIMAGQTLSFEITCTDQGGFGWLSVGQSSGLLSPGDTVDITVYCDTYSLVPGDYSEAIVITSNDPDEPLINIPIDLSVTYGDDAGVSEIINPPDTAYAGPIMVSARIENFGAEDQFNVPVFCEIIEGIFTTFLEEDFSGSFLPSGWTQEQYGEWTQSYSNYAGGVSPEAKLGWSDIIGDYAYIQTPQIDTFGAPVLTLEFKHFIDHYEYGGGDYSCRVLVRSSPMDMWTDVTPWTNPISGNVGPESISIDISSDIGPGTQARFEFDGYYWDIDYWYIDDVKIHSETGKDPGDIVYESNTTVDLPAYSSVDISFIPDWIATPSVYGISVWTDLPSDEDASNDQKIKVVTIEEPQGFVLNLVNFPMYEADADPGYNEMCGPAVAQMALNYMWWNSSVDPEPPMTFDDQMALYDSGIENNSDPGLPYFDLQGMWHTVQYNKPMPYSEYGYNFLKRHDADQDEMLKQICQWINYTVGTYGGHAEGYPLHVPSVIPAYGDYSNWMAIRGIRTNGWAYPLPDELTIYGFWVNDPLPGGLGENSYKEISEFTDDYYQAMTIGDYIGEYLAVLEPPESAEHCELNIAESQPWFTPMQRNLLIYVRTHDRVSEQLKTMTDQWIIRAAIDGVTEELIPYDEGFAAVFENTVPGKPMFIENAVGNDYYAVPFDLRGTVVVVLIDADDGSFKETSWVEDPVKYLPISREEAQQIAFEFAVKLGLKIRDPNDIQPELVHRKSTLYYPEWQVLIGEYGIYIDQDGTVTYIIFK